MDVQYNELESLRDKINQIDEKLLKLFQQRMSVVADIADYKKEHNLPVYDKGREQIILDKIKNSVNPDLIQPSEKFFTELMAISREVQSTVKKSEPTRETTETLKSDECSPSADVILGYQGLPGSYSEQALMAYFGQGVKSICVDSFEDIFLALQAGEITYGILPIENSSTGGIAEVYDLLCRYGFYIIGEKCLSIDHHLLAPSGAKITDIIEVYSHPQGFSQCSRYLQTHAHWEKVSCSNTAVSAKMVADSGLTTKAAIASKQAADMYNLQILERNINNNHTNFTRFIIIARDLEITEQADKISLAVTIKHEPGSLYKILKYISNNGLNMLKIESRPIAEKPWEYLFYIDLEGNLKNEPVMRAIKSIQNDSTFYQLLGNYLSDGV